MLRTERDGVNWEEGEFEGKRAIGIWQATPWGILGAQAPAKENVPVVVQ